MNPERLAAVCLAVVVIGASTPVADAASPPKAWDNLVLVKSKRLKHVYLHPQADFRHYTKVMFDPTEVSFRKDWVRDYNMTHKGAKRLTEEHAEEVKKEVSTGFGEIFAKTYREAGYQVVNAPGPDVLRVRTAVVNLYITAPDVMTAGRSRTYSSEAGEAALILEARNSQTGDLLGRAVDARAVGDSRPYLRNSVTNRADFRQVFQTWANASVKGLNELKTASTANTPTVAER